MTDLSITKPNVGGDTNTWGAVLNAALDAIVAAVNSRSLTTDTQGVLIGQLQKATAPSLVTGLLSDYTGRIGTPGTGSDNRTQIQAALNAASNLVGTDYYRFLSRRSTTVKLPPGDYWVSASPLGGASLVVPVGVTFDTTDANLFFQYPSTATLNWCAIQVTQYANLIAGKLSPVAGTTPPSTDRTYDAVRLYLTDNNSRVMGYKDSQIQGFTGGAAVRGVGAWLSWVEGLRMTSCAYGYVATNVGDAMSPAIGADNPGGTHRVHTDVTIRNCTITNMSNGGVVGPTKGTAADYNGIDFAYSGLTVNLNSCVLENIGSFAVSLGTAFNFNMTDCHLEEVGSSLAMISLNGVRVARISGTMINLSGRSVPGPTGDVTPSPFNFLYCPAVQVLEVDSTYCFNSLQNSMAFVSHVPVEYYDISGVFCDSLPFAGGPIPVAGAMGTRFAKASWNTGHQVLGSKRIWVDASNNLRTNTALPANDTDGETFATPPWRVEVTPWGAPALATNFATVTMDANAIGGALLGTNGSQNALIAFDVMLGAGTWTLDLLHAMGSSRGIYEVSIDNTVVGSIDGYSAANAYNSHGVLAALTIAATGKHRVQLRMNAKNASSSSYTAGIQQLVLQRTA